MPDISELFKNWWKQIAAVVALSLLAVALINFFKPKQYLSIATALPASSFASDKSKIFSENIQALYSALGEADDLDRIVGTSKLDTAYFAIADQFNLWDHYKIKAGPDARGKAAAWLKKNTSVMKSEYGELKVKVWDTDPELAPQLADSIMQQLNHIHSSLQNQENINTLTAILSQREKLRSADSSNQLQQLNKLATEYQLMTNRNAPVLFFVEHAKPSYRADRPKWLQSMLATAVLAFLFALLAAMALQRRKNELR